DSAADLLAAVAGNQEGPGRLPVTGTRDARQAAIALRGGFGEAQSGREDRRVPAQRADLERIHLTRNQRAANAVGTPGLPGARERIDRAPRAVPALFLLLRVDRFPVRARGLLRELPRPLEKKRRRRIIACGTCELLGRGGEIARTIACQSLPIGLRAGKELRRDLSRHAERLEKPYRLAAAPDADRVALAPDERPAGRRYRCLRSDDGRAVTLVRTFKPRGRLHHLAHHRVVEAPPRADVADQRLAGVEPDALPHRVAECGGHAIEPAERRGASQRRVHSVAGIIPG